MPCLLDISSGSDSDMPHVIQLVRCCAWECLVVGPNQGWREDAQVSALLVAGAPVATQYAHVWQQPSLLCVVLKLQLGGMLQ